MGGSIISKPIHTLAFYDDDKLHKHCNSSPESRTFFTTFVPMDEKMAEEIFGATKAKAMLQLTIVINYHFLDIPSISVRSEYL